METKEQYLLEAKNLSKYFPVKNFFGKLVQEVRAVDRVNLSIKKGETFGLVGESGCGKSTLGRTLIRMYEPTDGILTYDGHDITKTKGKELLAYHKRMQIIFQDPYSAEDLQQELGLTYLFVAHDLSMVRHISDRIGVMYLGKIVESGDSDEVYDNPCHPYTRALLASIPIADPKRALSLEHCGIEGDLPSPLHVPSGCRFHTRCPYATEQCRQQEPELEERTPGHMVACWKK